MLIICEGVDGAGKSTLVAKLHDLITKHYPGEKVEVLRKGPPALGAHPLDEYEVPLLSYRPGTGHHIICDRWHWGEWVYPDVLGRRTKADRATWYHIELFLQSRGARVVHLTEPVDTLRERITQRGDDLVRPDQVERLSQRYDFVSQTTLTAVWPITPSPERIVQSASELERTVVKHNQFVTYVGPRFPDVVLVGDVRGDTFDGDERPAFMPYHATSGHYLLSHLRAKQFQDVGLINTCDADDVEAFMDLHHVHDVSYVALGRNAHHALRNRGLDAPGVPHPQFVRRFAYRHGNQYAEAIQRVASTREDLIEWRPSA